MTETDGERPMLEIDTEGPFEGWDCPRGHPQPDPDRLYCDECREGIDERLAEEFHEQWGSIREIARLDREVVHPEIYDDLGGE